MLITVLNTRTKEVKNKMLGTSGLVNTAELYIKLAEFEHKYHSLVVFLLMQKK